ncbi:MAG TPA: SLC13 family permease [Pyrinomonadaceae bacterium]|nr:SLC13 family permease [Pyrinomonadaceae bacterium]
MSPIAIVIVLLFVAVVLFATERIPIDIVTILLVIALVVTGVLTAGEAFAGFGNDIVITISGLFILTGGLVKTGVIDVVGRRLHRIAGGREFNLTVLVMVVAAACAAVLKNTTTTAMFVPVVLGMCARARVPPSKLMMPLAFGAILGGTCTLIGTSTNLAVSGAIQRYGLQPFSMFELTPVGVAIVAVGLLYMLLLGLRLLPRRGGAEDLTEQYHIREYMSEVLVLPGSPLVGKTLAEANLSDELDLTVVGILRGKQGRIAPSSREKIEAEDLLLVQGRIEDILRVKNETGIEIRADFKLSDRVLESGDVELFEAMVLRGSDFTGRTLKGLRFRQRFQLTVLAVNRQGVALLSKISMLPLRFGDVLLLQGKRELIEQLVADGQFLLLEDVSERRGRASKRRWALLAFGVFLFFSITHPPQVPLAVAVLLGVLILLASRAVRVQEIYDLIEWRLIVLIAGMISFGTALEKSGADKYLADLIVQGVGSYGGLAVLAGFFVLTVALTQPMSNQAAALVVVPIAVKTAVSLGLNPRTFAVMVTYAASCSFLTPLEPACVLIFTPGRYRFFDFVKVGSILTVAVFAVVMLLVPVVWPMTQSANLSVQAGAAPDPVTVGQNVTYTVTLTNKGPDTAHNVKLVDELPGQLTFVSCKATEGGTCEGTGNNRAVTFPSLTKGAAATVTIIATVNEDLTEGTIVNNAVRVESPTPDAVAHDNSATVASTVYH